MANEFIIKKGFKSKGNSEVTGSVMILSEDTPGVRVVSNNDNSEEVKIYDAKLTIEDSGAELATLATNVNSNRLGSLQLANWTSNLVGVFLNGYSSGLYANWIAGALIVGRNYSVSQFQHPVALDVTGSAIVTGSFTATGDITSSGTFSGDGSALTNLQRPITTSFSHFTASLNNTGLYFIVGAHTCSIQSSSVAPCPVGSEFEFFQTSSGNLLFATGSGVTLLSKDNKQKLGGTHSGAALKKVAAEVWHLVGNLG